MLHFLFRFFLKVLFDLVLMFKDTIFGVSSLSLFISSLWINYLGMPSILTHLATPISNVSLRFLPHPTSIFSASMTEIHLHLYLDIFFHLYTPWNFFNILWKPIYFRVSEILEIFFFKIHNYHWLFLFKHLNTAELWVLKIDYCSRYTACLCKTFGMNFLLHESR